jgi:hypothetical protein
VIAATSAAPCPRAAPVTTIVRPSSFPMPETVQIPLLTQK